MTRDHWERQAFNWAAWARTPGFDAYWQYSSAFFELVPAPAERTLEVGCGEGRVARDLAHRGHHVTAVDGSPSRIRLARQADARGAYLVADAAVLPFASESFDLVVFYNSLMDIDDMEAGVDEAARVLRPGGKLCASVTHPFADAGRFASREPGAPFVVGGEYLGPRRWFHEAVERDGLAMDFSGWAYPLESYVEAHEHAGLVIEALREPMMPAEQAESDPAEARWRRIPMFLMWRAAKTA